MEFDRLEFLLGEKFQGSIAKETDPGIDRIDRIDLEIDPEADREADQVDREADQVDLETAPATDRIDRIDRIDQVTDRIDLNTDPGIDRIGLETDPGTGRIDLDTGLDTDLVTDPKTDRIDLDTVLDIDRTGKSKWYKPFSKNLHFKFR
jgi:hypothetical protein